MNNITYKVYRIDRKKRKVVELETSKDVMDYPHWMYASKHKAEKILADYIEKEDARIENTMLTR